MEPPTEKQKIINRIIDSINSRKKRIEFAESIGINPIWVKDQYKKQLIFCFSVGGSIYIINYLQNS